MARSPRQILVLPYRFTPDGHPEYLIFKRADQSFWQGIAGGAEDDEEPIETARREAFEEAAIPQASKFWQLDSFSTVPADCFKAWKTWPNDIYVIPEYFFSVEVTSYDIRLSEEHTDYKWCNYKQAYRLLKWDSNKTALWELNQRLQRNCVSS